MTASTVAWELRGPAMLLDVRLFYERGLASGSVTILAVHRDDDGVADARASTR